MSIGQGVDPSYTPEKDAGFTGLTPNPHGAAKIGEIGQDHAVPTGYQAGIGADAAFVSQAASELQGVGMQSSSESPAQSQAVDPSYKKVTAPQQSGLTGA